MINVEHIKLALGDLVPDIKKAIQKLKTEVSYRLWAIDYIKDIAKICLPDEKIIFEKDPQRYTNMLLEQEFKECCEVRYEAVRLYFKLQFDIKS